MGSSNDLKYPDLLDLLVSVLGDYRRNKESHTEAIFNCPNCAAIKGVIADNKYNLEVNYGKGIYNCWACGKSEGTHGTIYDLFKRFGSAQDVQIYKAIGLTYEYVIDEEEMLVRERRDVIVPPEFIPLADKENLGVYQKAYKYLKHRGITNDIIKKFSIGWCYDGAYENRIVAPSINDDGEWDYFTARSIEPYVKPKYLNCDVDKEDIVFNVSLVNWNKIVFIVEGVFDHIVTPNSIPMLGKGIYPLLEQVIYENAKNKVVIMTDPDAVEAGVNFYRQLDGGNLLGRVLINFLPKYYDPAKFFEKFGFEAYKRQLMKSCRLKD